jgi:Flp pilus assembly pilin Flp
MALVLLQLRSWLSDREDRGASLVEYALLLAFIAVVCVVAVGTFGGDVSQGIDSGVDAFP